MQKSTLFLLMILGFLSACNVDSDAPAPGSGDGTAPDLSGLTANTEVTDGSGNTYSVGFDQVSGINQDPYVLKEDGSGNELWRLNHENTPVDSRAVLVTLDAEGNPWVIFTVDGGSNDAGYINKKEIETDAFSGVYANSYGSGGGAKVSIIAKLNPSTGKIVKGSFMTARLTSGSTNTLNITKIGFKDGNFAFEISSSAWPPGKGTSYSRFPDITDEDRVDGSFKVYYEMSPNLSEITEAILLTE